MSGPQGGSQRDGDGGNAAALSARTRTVIAIGLVGMLLGFLWGVADVPRYSATATVLVTAKGGVPAEQIQLDASAQLAQSAEVADGAAALIGGDVAGADLLSEIDVGTDSSAGAVAIEATADTPDFAAAAANGYAEALVDAGGNRYAAGAAAAIPTDPSESRSGVRWGLLGLALGLLLGFAITALRSRGSRPVEAEVRDEAGDERVREKAGRPFDFPRRRPEPKPEPDEPAKAAAEEPEDEQDILLAEDAFGAPVLASFADPALLLGAEDGVMALDRSERKVFARLAEQIGLADEDPPSRVAVLDVTAGGGAMEILIGLAVAAGEEGLRTILVEADLADPALAGLLGVRSAPGLRDYLGGDAGPRDVLRGARLGDGDIVCVPAGDPGASPPEGVAGDRFAGLMERLPKVYDIVLVAGPPAHSEDATAIAELMDGVVLVSADVEDAGPRIAGAVAGLGDSELLGGVLTGPGGSQSGRQGGDDRPWGAKR